MVRHSYKWRIWLRFCGVGCLPRSRRDRCPTSQRRSCAGSAVCKRWNSLICNPEFRALCNRNGAQDESFLVARSFSDKRDSDWWENRVQIRGGDWFENIVEMRGWVILDVKARRWYTIDSKLTDRELFNRSDVRNWGRFVAMDGGLVCQVLRGAKTHESTSVIVSNPMAQTESRLLPTPKHHLMAHLTVVGMLVDASADCYTIFVLPNYWKHQCRKLAPEETPFMVMYESRTNAWRSSSVPALTEEVFLNVVESIVCFNGLLYVLAYPNYEDAMMQGYKECDDSYLLSYNHVEDNWKDTDVVINLEGLWKPKFLVSDNRLFLASWAGKKAEIKSYQVSEINLQERTLRTVLRVTPAAMAELFVVDSWVTVFHSDMFLHAVGVGKSIILLCMNSGITRVYDLRTCTWDALLLENQLPLFPTSMSAFKSSVCFGKPMTLVMPTAS